MNRPFPIGSKVRYVGGMDYSARPGATATVSNGRDSGYVYLVWDRNELSNSQNDGGYEPENFELVVERKKEIDWFAINGMFR